MPMKAPSPEAKTGVTTSACEASPMLAGTVAAARVLDSPINPQHFERGT